MLGIIINDHVGEIVSFKIYNVVGEMVRCGKLQLSSTGNSLNISDLSSGWYNLTLEFKTKIEAARFIKNYENFEKKKLLTQMKIDHQEIHSSDLDFLESLKR